MKKLLCLCLLMFGCAKHSGSVEEAHQRQYEYDKNNVLAEVDNNLIFFKDSVTGICFAGTARVFTYVPCNQEIDRIAVTFNSTRK